MFSTRNRLSNLLTSQQEQDIDATLSDLESRFSFLITLTEKEKMHKTRLGTDNWSFVRAAKEAYDDLPALLPRFVDPMTYENDLGLLLQIKPYKDRMQQLINQMEDTSILLGDLAYKDSLSIFSESQEADRRGVARARHWFQKLRTRFFANGNRYPDVEDVSEDEQPIVDADPGMDDDPTPDPGSQGGSVNN